MPPEDPSAAPLAQLTEHLGLVDPSPGAEVFLRFALDEITQHGTRPLTLIPGEELPLEHTFTPGLYARTITLHGPIIVASRVHLSEHPFLISAGDIYIWDETHGVQALVAHHLGITKPGTFRLAYVRDHCVWTTFHATDETDPERIQERLTITPTFCRLEG